MKFRCCPTHICSSPPCCCFSISVAWPYQGPSLTESCPLHHRKVFAHPAGVFLYRPSLQLQSASNNGFLNIEVAGHSHSVCAAGTLHHPKHMLHCTLSKL